MAADADRLLGTGTSPFSAGPLLGAPRFGAFSVPRDLKRCGRDKNSIWTLILMQRIIYDVRFLNRNIMLLVLPESVLLDVLTYSIKNELEQFKVLESDR